MNGNPSAKEAPLWRRALSRAGLCAYRVARALRVRAAARQARRVRRRSRAAGDTIRVAYGHLGFPAAPHRAPPGGGGGVKYLWLEERFPHAFPDCDLVYVVSSSRHPRVDALLDAARRRGVPVVWNQNGAYFPHSYGRDAAARGNSGLASLMRRADYVFYQSDFARSASDHFLGPCACPSEILYNAVNVSRYVAAPRAASRSLTLLAAGSHDDAYRIPLVLDTFAHVRQAIPDARLIVAGRVHERDQKLLRERLARAPERDAIEITGPYTPDAAPALFARGDIFLHAKYCDVCPSVVLEAMAAGLPVVYSATGGTPELVGEGGIGVPGENDWDHHKPPSAEALAEAVLRVARNLQEFSASARARVASRFDLAPWLDRHAAIFSKLIKEAAP
jgi:glycosyltransferase involved in cell wall biosynthesis